MRTFNTIDADIVVRSDGWIEIAPRRVRGTITGGHYTTPSNQTIGGIALETGLAQLTNLFHPAAISNWVQQAKAVIASPDDSIPQAKVGGEEVRWFRPRVLKTIDGTALIWSQEIPECSHPAPQMRAIRDSNDPVLVALDSAVLLARKQRSEPIPFDQRRTYWESELSCPSYPVSNISKPYVPASVPAARVAPEVVLSFVITNMGLVDTASVQSFSFVPAALVAHARYAMSMWRLTAPAQGSVALRQRTTRVVRFEDPRFAGDSLIVERWPISRIVVRSDGWIRVGEGEQLVSGAEIREWLDQLAAAQRRAHLAAPNQTYSMRVLGDTMTRIFANEDWQALLGSRDGAHSQILFQRLVNPDSTRVRASLMRRFCTGQGMGYGGELRIQETRELFERAADLSDLRGGSRAPDSAAIHEPHEVGCTVFPRDSTRWLSFQQATTQLLGSRGDIALAFSVGRDGRVEERSLEVLGMTADHIPDSLRRILEGTLFRPAEMGGVTLRQRVYSYIAGRSLLPAPPQPVKSACAYSSAGPVMVNVVTPEQGADRNELEKLASDVGAKLVEVSKRGKWRPSFRAVVDWTGAMTFFAWSDKPTSVQQQSEMEDAFYKHAFAPRQSREAIAIDVMAVTSCN